MTVRCEDKNLTLEYTGKARSTYLYRVPVSHSLKDVLNPDYFGLVMASNRLLVGDRINIEWEDFSCVFDLLVLAQSPSVSQLICRKVTEPKVFGDLEFPDGWEAQWLGGAEHYGIFYKGVIKDQGLLTKEACLTRINAMITTDAQQAAGRKLNADMTADKPKKAAKTADAEAA